MIEKSSFFLEKEDDFSEKVIQLKRGDMLVLEKDECFITLVRPFGGGNYKRVKLQVSTINSETSFVFEKFMERKDLFILSNLIAACAGLEVQKIKDEKFQEAYQFI